MSKELETAYQSVISPATAEKFISILKISAKEDPLGASSFLRDCINDDIPGIQNIFKSPFDDEERNTLLVKAQIIAAYLLLQPKTEGFEFQQKYMLLLEILSKLSRRSARGLTERAADSLCGKTFASGYSWDDISDGVSADILAYKIVNSSALASSKEYRSSYEGKGSLVISEGEIKVSAYPSTETGLLSRSMSVCSEKIGLYSRDSRDERLKASEVNDIRSIEKFTDTFQSLQLECRPKKKDKLKIYHEGDKMNILLKDADDDGNLLVKTIDPSYHVVSGMIGVENLTSSLTTADLLPYLFDDSCFVDATLGESDGKCCLFSIYDTYVRYAEKQASFFRSNNMLVPAKAVRILGKERIVWISYNGVGMISFYDDTVRAGDVRTVSVVNLQYNGNMLFINVRIAGDEGMVSNLKFDDDEVLKYFTREQGYLMKTYVVPKTFVNAVSLDVSSVRSLATMILNVDNERCSLECYRNLCTARLLYTLTGDDDKAACARGKAAYLKDCILFARGETISFPQRDVVYDSEDDRRMLSILQCLGRQDLESALCSLLATVPLGSPAAKAARVILAKNAALVSDNDLGFSDSAMRREIGGILGVSDMVLDEDYADIPKGKYGNTERQFREFKSSYVYRNDDTGADFQKQGRDEVFQAVCGLLNTEGGQVYIGVNNNGDPIVDSSWGIASDIKWLKANYIKVNGIRSVALGHNVPKVTDIDSYVNFLCEEKRIYFKDSLLGNIIIEPTEDMDAICISVSPAEFEIAYLFEDSTHTVGQAFRRDGNRTIPMNETEKRKRLMKLKSVNKEVDFQIKIQEAIDQHRTIIMKNYISSDVRDRFLAPINLLYGGESVWCVDLQDKDKKCKQFRLSRAGGVEVKDEKYPHGKSDGVSDIFRGTGERNIHVKLKMSNKARNLLVEEFPEVKYLSPAELYQSDGSWILDTMVSRIDGFRRFYIGLADKIEILETEDHQMIIKDIRDFVSKHISR